jgi:hypothetical protein
VKHKYKWLSRRVASPGPYLTLVLSAEEMKHAVRRLIEYPLEFPERGASTTTFVNNKTGELCAIVSLSESVQKNNNAIEVVGLLVHEAVHVWQAHADKIGEAAPGREQEAYAIQSIAQDLMAEYARRLDK